VSVDDGSIRHSPQALQDLVDGGRGDHRAAVQLDDPLVNCLRRRLAELPSSPFWQQVCSGIAPRDVQATVRDPPPVCGPFLWNGASGRQNPSAYSASLFLVGCWCRSSAFYADGAQVALGDGDVGASEGLLDLVDVVRGLVKPHREGMALMPISA
jgi:hypothetical protein